MHYICELCNFKANRVDNYKRHIGTTKHKSNVFFAENPDRQKCAKCKQTKDKKLFTGGTWCLDCFENDKNKVSRYYDCKCGVSILQRKSAEHEKTKAHINFVRYGTRDYDKNIFLDKRLPQKAFFK